MSHHNRRWHGCTIIPVIAVAGSPAATANDQLALIPTTALPDGSARQALAAILRWGAPIEQCCVYHPRNREVGWETPGNLRIWLAPPNPAWDSRMTPAEWQTAYATATSTSAGEEGEGLEELQAQYRRLKLLHSLTPLTPSRTPLGADRAGADEPDADEQTTESTNDDYDEHFHFPARRAEDVAEEIALEQAITVRWWLQRIAG